MRIMRTGGPVLPLIFAAILFVQGVSAEPNPSNIGSGSVMGTVTDPTGAVVPNATVTVTNPVTGFKATAKTNANGAFEVRPVPFNNYHVAVSAPGFNPGSSDVDVRSVLPVPLPITLQIATAQTAITVEGGAEDLVETTPVAHTDIGDQLIARLPVQTTGSALSSIVEQATPGVTSDSNGMFHPQGEHSDTTFSVDNQPISDQQSRVFSNQLSPDTIASMEVITGVPPAEYGDKASLIVRTTTKSGIGASRPMGSVTTSYGSFGTSGLSFNFAAGTKNFGNFLAVDGLNSGRFLDSPEFRPLHDQGNSEDIFDHIDYQLTNHDIFHLNLALARSWFQIPNTYDQQVTGQDQRQQLDTFNVAPSYSHQFNANTLLSANAYVRQDRVHYYPSADIFSDQPATLAQNRRLTNAGLKVDVSYVKGVHNAKAGVQFSHTFLTEHFHVGITDPAFNSPCTDANGVAVPAPGILSTEGCAAAGLVANASFQPGLVGIDLTRGGSLFNFNGHADIKQEAAYVEDQIKLGSVNIMAGVRGDHYNGLSQGSAIEPRLGLSYSIKKTGTVLRGSYGRIFLTPYNENLVLSSSTGIGGLASGAFGEQRISPARRNQFNVGIEQPIEGKLSITAEYFWKFTAGDYDFDTILNTPLTFPIQWRKSKIDGASVRVNLPAWRGLTAYSVMGHTRSRFFGPEVGGILFNSPLDVSVFRIDHDQALEQTTHLQYQIGKRWPWVGFTWKYESGLVAGAVPDYATALTFTPDQQAQIGLFCGSTFATLSSPIRSCSSPVFGARLVRIPAAGTENPDTNPPRVAPRNLFDLSIGWDNIFRGDRYKWDLQLSAVNLTNQVALYNFLSTFSGTHFVSPRSLQAQLRFSF